LNIFLKVLDSKNVKRRFRASNYQTTTRVKPFICVMPMRLDEGWHQVQFNLADFTRRAYGSNFVEVLRVQVIVSLNTFLSKKTLFHFCFYKIHANCRLRRIYFADRAYNEEELPSNFKLYLPVSKN
jgi:hypothetical protein